MEIPQNNYPGIEAFNIFVESKQQEQILVAYRNLADYDGMVLSIMIVFDVPKAIYQLDLQWMCFGLDFYGDTLQETYLYQFKSMDELLAYLLIKYGIAVTDIPKKYTFDQTLYPSYLDNKEKRPAYEVNWQRFQDDFKKDLFLEASLKLVYSSIK